MAGKGGARAGAGNPGYGKLKIITERFEKIAPLWWNTIEGLLKSKRATERQFALAELNKIQVKMIPQKIGGDGTGDPILLSWIQSLSPTSPATGRKSSTTPPNAG